MNAIARRVASAWRRPAVTACLGAAFLAWIGIVVVAGVRELNQVEAHAQVRRHIIVSRSWNIALVGSAERAQLRNERPNPSFVGGFEIDYRRSVEIPGTLRLRLGIDHLLAAADCELHDEAGARLLTWRITPADDACDIDIPLPRARGRCSITISDGSARLRHRTSELREGLVDAGARPVPGLLVGALEGVRIRMAAGWLGRRVDLDLAKNEELFTLEPAAWFVEVDAPGPHRIVVPFRRLATTAPAPRLDLDGRRLASTIQAPKDATSEVWTLTADADLAAGHVLSFGPATPIAPAAGLARLRGERWTYAVRPRDVSITRR